jgi:hypothetical protein
MLLFKDLVIQTLRSYLELAWDFVKQVKNWELSSTVMENSSPPRSDPLSSPFSVPPSPAQIYVCSHIPYMHGNIFHVSQFIDLSNRDV